MSFDLKEFKRLAGDLIKSRLEMDNDCDMNMLDHTYWCEELQCNIPRTFIPTHYTVEGQQLYKNYKFIEYAGTHADAIITELEKAKERIEKLEKALEFYADKDNYYQDDDPLHPSTGSIWDDGQLDCGETARKALKKEERGE